ncbi:o-succinylbenzoate--CoA ligase [Mobilicoccus massiliensis]|uniref:o-succinylbenzoate--CoA ligase n=1 Tax=Mobilicoccus massiliensis TaxID=1522310 RepID=UPI00069363C9|nr:o-succinylbenzoate--CoA ligase [Mobilicoccus massiliensis]
MDLRPLPLTADPTAQPGVLDRLADAVAGRGPLLLPHASGEDTGLAGEDGAGETATLDREAVPAGGGIAVGTSGSTGAAKRAVLPGDALVASADATHARLGGPGQWLLALPAHHIAGLQVLLRSLRVDQTPAVVPPGSFTPEVFVAGVETMTATRRYASLVPTQLVRILDDDAARRAARSLDAILVGGSQVRPALLESAHAHGLAVVVTYGMSETAGGCVYDGVPLDGVHLRLERGRVHLAGAVLSSGYLVRRPESPFVEHGGLRWFRTGDMGHIDEAGRLVVAGRIDDVVVSGGLKVWPAEVERALAAHLPGGCDLAVVGVPDPEWGQRVAVVVEYGETAPTPNLLTDLLDDAKRLLPAHARPRLARLVREIPRLGPGKPDRTRLTSMLMEMESESEWDDESVTVHEEG